MTVAKAASQNEQKCVITTENIKQIKNTLDLSWRKADKLTGILRKNLALRQVESNINKKLTTESHILDEYFRSDSLEFSSNNSSSTYSSSYSMPLLSFVQMFKDS